MLDSATVVRFLLAADLRLSTVPSSSAAGSGSRPEVSSGRSPVSSTARPHGAITVHHRRAR
ncbi:hypothetical protein AB0F88_25715 [Streptosporangium sp. NPDC023963]|uniref:hypothetical protein n=1 Tax=Streptosporangium sp. NPDC023963 TaxID=3155608 RepID=UPI00342A1AFF